MATALLDAETDTETDSEPDTDSDTDTDTIGRPSPGPRPGFSPVVERAMVTGISYRASDTDDPPIPSRASEISSEWLTACLQRGAGVGVPRVRAFELSRIGAGKGFAGDIQRVRLTYERQVPGAPSTLIAKFPSNNPTTRQLMADVRAYEKEVRFYREIAPDAQLATPRCYFGHFEPRTGSFVLLLEDLTPAQTRRPGQSFNAREAEQILLELARFHAQFWNSERLRKLDWSMPDDAMVADLRERFAAGVERLPENLEREAPTVATAAKRMARIMRRTAARDSKPRPPRTLVHSDVHVANIFVPGGAAGRFALIDWQSVRIARTGLPDVARLLVMCMEPRERRGHGRRLLRTYHDTLVAHGVHGFSWRQCRASYVGALTELVFGAVLAGSIADTVFADSDPAVVPTLLRRLEVGIADAKLPRALKMMGPLMIARSWLTRPF